jgi:hypothetical protein
LDRCLGRHRVCDLNALRPREDAPKGEVKTFKDDEPGFVHVDPKYLPQMPEEGCRRCLLAAIDRAARALALLRTENKWTGLTGFFRIHRMTKGCPEQEKSC